jgi:predicted enzyme related to lactoylglutathione lyase
VKGKGAVFKWRKADDPNSERCTAWAPFPADTDYFAPSKKPFMINLQVENLDEVLTQLKREGVDVDPKVESYDYGKFGWIMDPEGNRIELWDQRKAQSALRSRVPHRKIKLGGEGFEPPTLSV